MNANADPRWIRTRQALLDGGRRVMSAKGVEAATILEIVRAAGVSQPSFYNHFDSKEALAAAIAAEFFQADAAYKRSVFSSTENPAIAIAMNCLHTLQVASRDPVVAWVLVHAGASSNLMASSSEDELVAMITAGIKSRHFSVGDARTAALMIRGAAFPVLQDILQATATPQADKYFALLVLQMLGLTAAAAKRAWQQASATMTAQQPNAA